MTIIDFLLQIKSRKGLLASSAIVFNVISLFLFLKLVEQKPVGLDEKHTIFVLLSLSFLVILSLSVISSLFFSKMKKVCFLEAYYQDGQSYISGLILLLYVPIFLYAVSHPAFTGKIIIFILLTWFVCTIFLKIILFTPITKLENTGLKIRQRMKWILGACIGTYGICLFGLSLKKYLVFGGYGYDNAAFYRFFLNISKKLWFHEIIDGGQLLSWHIDFMLYPFAVLFSIWPSMNTFLFIKTAMISVSAIPLYLIIKEEHNSIVVLLIVLSYLLFHQIAGTSVLDFHEVILAPFFLLFTFYFYKQEKYELFIVFMLLSLCIKENISFVIMMFFIYGLMLKRSKKWLLPPLIVGSLWLFVSVKILLPYFGSSLYIHPECLKNIFSTIKHPWNMVKYLGKPRILALIYSFFQPFLFILPLLSRKIVFIIPWFLLVIFEGRNPQIRTWHFLILIGFVFIAYSSALAKLKERVKSDRITIFISTIVLFVNMSCIPYWFRWEELRSKPYIEAQRRAIELIPKDASVCAPEYMLSHLADRRIIHSDVGFKEKLSSDIDFIIFDSHVERYFIEHLNLDITPKFIRELRELAPVGKDYPPYILHWWRDGIYVYRNGSYEGPEKAQGGR